MRAGQREDKLKKVWIGIAAGVLVLAIAGGAFWGGMVYGKSQASQAAVPFSGEGFPGRGGQFPEVGRPRSAVQCAKLSVNPLIDHS